MNEIQSFSNVINSAFERITVEEMDRARNIHSEWVKILRRIKSFGPNQNEGSNMADHTSVVDLQNGVLVVEADHPGWIELLQLHRKYILKGLEFSFPELKIHNMVFRLKGTGGNYGGQKATDQEIRRKIEARDARDEEMNRRHAGISAQPKEQKPQELPDELKDIFESLKKNMEDSENS